LEKGWRKSKEESGGGAAQLAVQLAFTHASKLRTKMDPHEKFTENQPGSCWKPSRKAQSVGAGFTLSPA
jgi:hypothetical protein